MKIPKRSEDPLFRIKYLGYNMMHLHKNGGMKDLLRVAKFQLAQKTGRLMKDPIWDSYTDVELLVEWFAQRFTNDKDLRTEFEFVLQGGSATDLHDFLEWADKEIGKNKKEHDKTKKETEDKVSFTPDVIGD